MVPLGFVKAYIANITNIANFPFVFTADPQLFYRFDKIKSTIVISFY